MKMQKRLLSFLLVLVMLCGTVLVPVGASDGARVAPVTDGAGTYTKKIVSVLYDNSYSMRGERWDYAEYAIQTLAAMLGPDDVLVLTPMNVPGRDLAVSDDTYTHEVILSDPDREAQITDMLENSFLNVMPDGMTPLSPISVVLNELAKRGMKTLAEAGLESGGAEYWTFVMTDGEFSDVSRIKAEEKYAECAKKYSNFHLVHLSFGPGAVDLTDIKNAELKLANNYSVYHSDDTAKLLETMQQVANQISGRYTADGDDYTVKGNKITVQLGDLGFAISNLSVLAQNTAATLTGATWNGQPLVISQPCVIVSPDGLKEPPYNMGNGYSAVVKHSGGLMTGGSIELTFSAPVGKLSLMLEPALKLRTIVERKDGGDWIEADRVYINSFMKAGDKVRVRYEVYAEGLGNTVDFHKLFGPVTESVTYAGGAYLPGDEITLVEGSHVIELHVTGKSGAYQLHDSYTCIVWKNPTDYRVVGEAISTDGGKNKKYDLEFTVYYNNKPVTAAELASYTWTVQGTDSRGAAVPLSPQVTADGKIKAAVDLRSLPSGEAVFYAKVVSVDGFVRETTIELTATADVKLHMTVERREGGGWVEAEAAYINRYMKAGDELRVVYKLYDEEKKTYVDTEAAIGPFTETVTYAGGTYRPGAAFPISAGRHEIKLTVRSDDGEYELTDSFLCVALTNASDYRVEGSETIADQGLGLLRNATFLVYVDNKPIGAAELAQYRWTITAKDGTGAAIAIHPTAQSDGSILVPLDLSTVPYGKIRLDAAVTDPDGFVREGVLEIVHEAKALSAVVTGSAQLHKTQNQLGYNTDAFTFAAQIDVGGKTVTLDPAVYTYRVTVNGKDVTGFCTVDGTNVVFVPTKDNLGELAGRLGDLEVRFEAAVSARPSIADSAEAKLSVVATAYEVMVSVEGEGTEPFRVKDSELSIYVTVFRDSVSMTADELREAWESGALVLKVKGGFLRNGYGFFKTVDVTEYNGVPALRIAPNKDMAWLAYCITGWVALPGQRTVSATYTGVSAAGTYDVIFPGVWAYLARLLIYFLIVHLAILIFFYRKIDRIAPGRYFRMTVTFNGQKIRDVGMLKQVSVNRSIWNRILWKRLLIPVVYWFHGTQTVDVGSGIVLNATGMQAPSVRIKRSKNEGAFLANMKTGEYGDVRKIQGKLNAGVYNKADYKNMSIGFEEKPLFKPAVEGAEATKKKQDEIFVDLRDFRKPVCLKKTGTAQNPTYTFIFYIPDKK